MYPETLVFVYGSLKKGFGNHRLLEDADFLQNDTIQNHTMYSLGAFPAIVPDDNADVPVKGELYSVTNDELLRLNRLEGYSGDNNPHNLYERKEIVTDNGHVAYVYYMNTPERDWPVVQDGDWSRAY